MPRRSSAEVYEIVEVNALPSINVKRSVRSVLLPPAMGVRWKAVHRAVRGTIRVLYALAVPMLAAVLVIEPRYARLLALAPVIMQLPMQVFDTSSLRVDILACLVTSYEFWLFSLINTVSSVILALHLGDFRAAVVPSHWYGIQMIVWADARIQSRSLAGWSLLAMAYQLFLVLVLAFKMVPSPSPFIVLQYKTKQRATTSGDVLVNSFVTLLVLMLRTAYRKRALSVKQRNNPMLVCFVSFRCRVKLQVCISGPTQQELSPVPRLRDTRATQLRNQQQLRFIPLNRTFSSQDVVWPRVAALFFESALTWHHVLLYMLGLCGVGVNGALFLGVYYLQQINFDFTIPAAVGLACSLSFYATFIACSQREILVHIVKSLDFVFTSLQITLSHLCVADMLRWDVRALAVLSGSMWTHWIITMDALTPAMRRRLWWSGALRVDGQVLAFSSLIQLFVMLELMHWDYAHLSMREVHVLTICGHGFTFRSAPFLIGRATTLLLWSARTLWRSLTSKDGDLLLLQGNVQFYANPKALHPVGSNWRSRLRGRFSVRPVSVDSRIAPTAKVESAEEPEGTRQHVE